MFLDSDLGNLLADLEASLWVYFLFALLFKFYVFKDLGVFIKHIFGFFSVALVKKG